MPSTSTLHKRGRRRRRRRTVAAPTEGYIVQGKYFRTLQQVWDKYGWRNDDKLPPRPTKAEIKRANAAARAAADANGCFHLSNGVRVQLAATPSAKAGLARLDRITAGAAPA